MDSVNCPHCGIELDDDEISRLHCYTCGWWDESAFSDDDTEEIQVDTFFQADYFEDDGGK